VRRAERQGERRKSGGNERRRKVEVERWFGSLEASPSLGEGVVGPRLRRLAWPGSAFAAARRAVALRAREPGRSATSTICAGAVQRHACAQRVEEPQVGLRKSAARGLCRTSSDLASPRCRPEPARLTCRRSQRCGSGSGTVPSAEANQHGAVFAACLESYPLTHCTSFVARRCSGTMRLAAATGCLGTGAGSDAAS
jgi:hypothetical protein